MNSSKTPLQICSFGNRRSEETSNLIRKWGGVPTIAPTMQEVPLQDQSEVHSFLKLLQSGEIQAVIFLTGVGAEYLKSIADLEMNSSNFVQALQQTTIITRSPKAAVVLKQWKLTVDLQAKAPYTSSQLVSAFKLKCEQDSDFCSKSKCIAIIEYGEHNRLLHQELQQQGFEVRSVTAYRWKLPDNLEPLQQSIQHTIEGKFDVLLFTSAKQISHLLQVAESLRLFDTWMNAARNCQIASIGPTCSEALRTAGLQVSLEASPPKLGTLIKLIFHSSDK